MERTALCHCGSLRVIVSGDPDRVYVCHCAACQRRTGAIMHSGAAYLKSQVRVEGASRVYDALPTAATRSAFISARTAAATFIGRVIDSRMNMESLWALSRIRSLRPRLTRSTRSRCIIGSDYRPE